MIYGVLGSGQLAWMLGLAAKKCGQQLLALDLKSDTQMQNELIARCDVITFESEFLNFSNWESLLNSKAVYPSFNVMKLLSDKWEQKKLFEKYSLPTAKFHLVDEKDFLGKRGVYKWSRQGYDGYGNFVAREAFSSDDFTWLRFAQKAKDQGSQIYWEELIPFQAECALVVARDKDGKCLKYPTFITEQQNSVCHWVYGPASHFYPELEKQIELLWPQLKAFLDAINYVGVLAFEMFWLDGKLLVNEIAPRVHNSAHITLDAFNWSQFDLHLKAFEGFGDLTLVPNSKFYLMKNILGSKDFELTLSSFVEEFSDSSALYWYGKNQSRAGRKLGHVNLCLKNSVEVNAQTLEHHQEILKKKEDTLWQKM